MISSPVRHCFCGTLPHATGGLIDPAAAGDMSSGIGCDPSHDVTALMSSAVSRLATSPMQSGAIA
jgi:hypothetical protein